jgi:hypothetical protein
MNKRILGALATVIVSAGVIAGIGTYVASAKNDSGVTNATAAGTYTAPDGTSYPHFTLSMNTYPNSSFGGHHGAGGGAHPDWVSYGAAGPYGEPMRDSKTGSNFMVPAHSAITITIWQYDSGETLSNDFFAKVRGTVDGTATLVERYDTKLHSNATEAKTITQIPHDAVGHTFTIHGYSSDQPSFFVNVPLLLADDAEVTAAEEAGGFTQFPTMTTFTIITGDAGEYIWNCEFPCGDGTVARFGNAMSSMSYMSGHFTVKG